MFAFTDDSRVREAAFGPSDAGRAAQGPSPAVSRAVLAADGGALSPAGASAFAPFTAPPIRV